MLTLSAAVFVLGASAIASLNNSINDIGQKQTEFVQSVTPQITTEPATETTTFEIIDISGLSAGARNWYFIAKNDHTSPDVQGGLDYKKYGAYYVGDTSEKKIFLTFDEGYENGYSAKILDILKEKDVKAAFFCTGSYLRDNPELVKRMAAEGHIVGNHSYNHLNQTTIGNDKIKSEINDCEYRYQEITGEQMPKFFRPPEGAYTEKSLAIAHNMGYKTIFWSFAYKDWLVDSQPGKQVAYNKIMNSVHNGAIYLLHAVSDSNTEALPQVIDDLKAQGYTFGTLYDLE